MNAIIEARYNLGLAFLEDAQYSEAISEFEAVIQLDSDFLDAHCGLSRAYLEQNELDKAQMSASAAIRLNPDYSPAHSLCDAIKNAHYDNGITFLQDGDYSNALSTFQKVLDLDPDYKHIHYNLGRAYTELKEFDNAITSFQCAIDSNRIINDVHYHLGNAFVEKRQYGKAIEHLEQANSIVPNSIETHFQLARAYRESGNLEAATNEITEILRLDPNYQPVHDLVESIKQIHYNKGVGYLNADRYSDAVASFQNVIALDPDYTTAQYNLGIAYLKLENYSRAIHALQKTVALDSTHKAAYHALALAYFGLHELEKARNAAKDALKIDPNFQPALSLLEAIDPSFSHLQIPATTGTEEKNNQPKPEVVQNESDEEVKDDTTIDSQSEKDEIENEIPDNPDIKKDLERGVIFLSNKQYQQAAASFKRVIKADPKCRDAYYRLGEAYMGIGAYEDATNAANEALKLDPQHKPVLELLQLIQYVSRLEINKKRRKKVLVYSSIIVLLGFVGFVLYRFGVIPTLDFDKLTSVVNNVNSKQGQSTNHSRKKVPSIAMPPKLTINTILEEPSGNGYIDAGEVGQIQVTIKNNGDSIGYVEMKVSMDPKSIPGLRLKIPNESFRLSKNQQKTKVINISALRNVKARDASIIIQLVGEKNITMETKQFDFKIISDVPEPEPVR